MNIVTGTGQLGWAAGAGIMTAEGEAAPPAHEIIRARLIFGSLGTCQGGSVTLSSAPAVAPRRARWALQLDGGAVFLGIVDSVTPNLGELIEVPLLAPHRQYLDAPGVSTSAGAAGSRIFGVPLVEPAPHEKLSDVLTRVLESYPTAEYGIGPDAVAAVGLPEYAGAATYALDDRALDFAYLGEGIPSYTTDAVFDPGEGWKKYVYSRGDVPAYVPRVTGQATANPPIKRDFLPLTWVKTDDVVFIGPLPGPQFDGAAHDIEQVGAIYALTLPENTDTFKGVGLTLTFPFRVDSIPESWDRAAVLVQIAEEGATGYTEVASDIPPAQVGTERGLSLTLPPELVARGGVTLRILFTLGFLGASPDPSKPTTGSVTLYPPKLPLEFDAPNLGAVVMPDGWGAPFSTGPIFQFRLKGVHVPPLRITGLPGGSNGVQYAAGAVVKWDKDDASTLITTQAWPYAGQRRR